MLRQDPGPTERILRDGTVTLTLSRGPERFPVPTLVGGTEEEARAALAEATLVVGRGHDGVHAPRPPGVVLGSSPGTGAELKRGAAVDLVVSKGPPPVTGARRARQDPQGRRRQLAGLGLDPLKGEEVFSDTVPAGHVVEQSTAAGQTLSRGAKITLTVSKGPDVVKVPDVTGKGASEAQRTLADAGLQHARSSPSCPRARTTCCGRRPGRDHGQARHRGHALRLLSR